MCRCKAMTPFSNALVYYRKRAGLSQTNVAKQLGVAIQYVWKLERAVKPPPSTEQIERIAAVLGMRNADVASLLEAALDSQRKLRLAAILRTRNVCLRLSSRTGLERCDVTQQVFSASLRYQLFGSLVAKGRQWFIAIPKQRAPYISGDIGCSSDDPQRVSKILLHAFGAGKTTDGIAMDMGQPCECLHIDMQGGREASRRDDRRSALRVLQRRQEVIEIEGWR